MHFWIDKRSQCSYSGRHRVPSSLSAGVGRGRGRVCAAGRKGMAAPVHRFQPVDPPRRPRTNRSYGPPPMPPVHSSRRQNTDSLYVEIPQPQQPTIASLAAARSVTPDTLLRTAALGLHHSPMLAPHLKFGMLVSFALATVFLGGAKYYFDRQVMRGGNNNNSSGEAGVVCAAVACVCGVGCALSLCRARPAPPPAPPERVSSTARRRPVDTAPPPQPAPPPQRPPQEPENISLIPMPREEPATVSTEGGGSPPPYHIAVLLPAPSPPPPAYSALS
ncbi:formin-like protein 20 isoform X2 [Aricia agestis]|uniref:formin-like protein 20 isoform X2 n=1 Tax=Aricia agestis TaxID=91739 RepID=UPI001C2068D7|nr:formin-like protein 20 isoform X2 [Aricia agestis]